MDDQDRRKVYVEVVSTTKPDGTVIPLRLIWQDGRSFPIDRVLDVRPAVARKVGGEGTRYLCRIAGHEKEVWLAHGQWFLEADALFTH